MAKSVIYLLEMIGLTFHSILYDWSTSLKRQEVMSEMQYATHRGGKVLQHFALCDKVKALVAATEF